MRARSIVIIALVVALIGALAGVGAAVVSGSVGKGNVETAHTPRSTPTPDAPLPQPTPTPSRWLSTVTDYVALGDSYAAGMGGGDEHGVCGRSDNAYPFLVSQESGALLTAMEACSGATTADVQRDQLGSLDENTQLVTLTIGGNDLDVAQLADTCSQGKKTLCEKAFSETLDLLNVLPDRLGATFHAVLRAAPNARVVVTGYPVFFELPDLNSPEVSTRAGVNIATGLLNQMIETAVTKLRKGGATIEYIKVSFAGHGLDSKTPWFHAKGIAAFHPTPKGYTRYAQTLTAALQASPPPSKARQ